MDFFRKKIRSGAEVSCAWRTCRSLGKQLPFLGPWARCHGEKCENTTGPSEQFETPLHGGAKFLHFLLISTLLVLISHWDPMARHWASSSRWTRRPHPIGAKSWARPAWLRRKKWWQSYSESLEAVKRNWQQFCSIAIFSWEAWEVGSTGPWWSEDSWLLVLSTKTRTIWPWLPSHFLTRTITAAMLKLWSCIARCRESSQWSNAFEAIYRLSTGKRHSRCCSKACFPTISNDVFPFSPIPKENADVFCRCVSQDWLQTPKIVSPQRGGLRFLPPTKKLLAKYLAWKALQLNPGTERWDMALVTIHLSFFF